VHPTLPCLSRDRRHPVIVLYLFIVLAWTPSGLSA